MSQHPGDFPFGSEHVCSNCGPPTRCGVQQCVLLSRTTTQSVWEGGDQAVGAVEACVCHCAVCCRFCCGCCLLLVSVSAMLHRPARQAVGRAQPLAAAAHGPGRTAGTAACCCSAAFSICHVPACTPRGCAGPGAGSLVQVSLTSHDSCRTGVGTGHRTQNTAQMGQQCSQGWVVAGFHADGQQASVRQHL